MSLFRPRPFATVVPLYSGEVVVQFGYQALRLWIPELGESSEVSPGAAPPPSTLPPTSPRPAPSPTPPRPEPWRGLPPFEPVNVVGLLRGATDSPELVGFVRVSPSQGLPEELDVRQIRTNRWPWLAAGSDVQLRAITVPHLSDLVESPAFDPTPSGSVIIHARGPYVDLTAQASPLSAAGDRGGEVIVVVHPPEDVRVPAWRLT